MKITTDHLDAVRGILVRASATLEDQRRIARAAAEQELATTGRVRLLQGAFDICASSFAQDGELSDSQLDSLPAEVQKELGYAKPVPEPAA